MNILLCMANIYVEARIRIHAVCIVCISTYVCVCLDLYVFVCFPYVCIVCMFLCVCVCVCVRVRMYDLYCMIYIVSLFMYFEKTLL